VKATIIRSDGTRIEAEGTPEEIARLAPGWYTLPATNNVCFCCNGLLTGVWCPAHGYRPPTVFPFPGVIWSVQNVAAAAAQPTTVFLGNANTSWLTS